MSRTFIFVYNADSGLFNTVTDIAHKILSPSTYSCNLCALTHGHFKVKDVWVGYLKQAQAEFEFLHRDEFVKSYGQLSDDLPAIFEYKDKKPFILFASKEINKLKNIEQLIDLMEKT